MAVRNGKARWDGNLKEGKGELEIGKNFYKGKYSFVSRFEEGDGTNPEELIAAAHAACYSMALSSSLDKSGHPSKSVTTTADVHLNKVDAGMRITKIVLHAEVDVDGISNEDFQRIAEETKSGCPISNALASVPIELEAKMLTAV
jgi:osmotically inducible protein OsmC